MYVCALVHVWYQQRSELGIRSPGTRVIGSCEPADIGAQYQTWVLYEVVSTPNC